MSHDQDHPFAALFGGSAYLQNKNTGSGGGLNTFLPTSSPNGLFSFWYWTYTGPGGAGVPRTILKMHPARGFTGGDVKIWFQKTSDAEKPRLMIRVRNAGSAFATFQSAPVPYGDKIWHHLIVAWNVGVSPNVLEICQVDGRPLDWALQDRGGAATFNVPYKSNQLFYVGTDGEKLGKSTEEMPFQGALAEFFFDPVAEGLEGGEADALVYAYRDAIRGGYAYSAGRLGGDGASALGRTPTIYLHGYYAAFTFNHGGNSSFNVVGTISAPDPTIGDPFWSRIFYGVNQFWQNMDAKPKPITPGKIIRGSLFDVPTVLEASASEVKPAIADSPTGLVSFWYKANARNFPWCSLMSTSTDNGVSFGLSVLTEDTLLTVVLSDGSDSGQGEGSLYFTSAGKLPNDGAWHHCILAWDTQAGSCIAFVDGASFAMALNGGLSLGAFSAVPYTTVGYTFQIGGVADAADVIGSRYLGHLSELCIYLADYDFVGALTSQLVAKFRHPGSGTARELGGTVSLPFGPDGPRPDFYLSGQPEEFVNSFAKTNGQAGHRWAADGTDADSTFAFTVRGGPLKPGNTDPFKTQELVS